MTESNLRGIRGGRAGTNLPKAQGKARLQPLDGGLPKPPAGGKPKPGGEESERLEKRRAILLAERICSGNYPAGPVNAAALSFENLPRVPLLNAALVVEHNKERLMVDRRQLKLSGFYPPNSGRGTYAELERDLKFNMLEAMLDKFDVQHFHRQAISPALLAEVREHLAGEFSRFIPHLQKPRTLVEMGGKSA